MSTNNSTTTEPATIDEEIVAYLDGELDTEAIARVERRLSEDATYRAARASFSTPGICSITSAAPRRTTSLSKAPWPWSPSRPSKRLTRRKCASCAGKNSAWLAVAAVALVSIASGYAVLYRGMTRGDRNLVRDLPVIEHVDEYLNIDDISFLKQLEQENLFAAEVDDGM